MRTIDRITTAEYEQMVAEILREQEQEAKINAAPVNLKTGKDRAPSLQYGGIQYQQCGGGRRVIRKKIGGD